MMGSVETIERMDIDQGAGDNPSTGNLNIFNESKENPMENALVIRTIIEFLVGTTDILKIREVNSDWKMEVDSLLQMVHSGKKVINFETVEEVQLFNSIFENNVLLHDSFKWSVGRELNFTEEYYSKFTDIVGQRTKVLDLSRHVVSLDDSRFNFRPFNVSMQAYKFEKIIFQHFPFLIELEITDMFFKAEQLGLIYHSAEDREKLYSVQFLTSLRTLKYHTYWDGLESPNNRNLYLSEELIKISPNLLEIHITLTRNTQAGGFTQRIFRCLSNFASQVRILTFCTKGSFNFKLPVEGTVSKDDFKNVQLQRLTFDDYVMINPLEHEKRLKFLVDYTSIPTTVEEFKMISERVAFGFHAPEVLPLDLNGQMQIVEENPSNEAKIQNILKVIPSDFVGVRVLEMKFPFPIEFASNIMNKFQIQFPSVEKLTMSMFPQPGQVVNPWRNLKKLTFKDVELKWNGVEGFMTFFNSLRNFAPQLVDLRINVKCYLAGHRETHILAYPFFVYMAEKWTNLEQFAICLNNVLKWRKGQRETYLGLESVEDLNDELGNFTTREITQLNISLIISELNFTMKFQQREFFNWLLATFPKHQNIKKLIDSYLFFKDYFSDYLNV